MLHGDLSCCLCFHRVGCTVRGEQALICFQGTESVPRAPYYGTEGQTPAKIPAQCYVGARVPSTLGQQIKSMSALLDVGRERDVQ